ARRCPLALLAGVPYTTLFRSASSCGDPSPVGVEPRLAAQKVGAGRLLSCPPAAYDSVTQVIGPAGGVIAVGHHFLWVDTMALADTVSITAVAPADSVRWVRFQPDGLQFRTNGAGRSAILFTSYKDCGVPTADTLRIAQVTDSL